MRTPKSRSFTASASGFDTTAPWSSSFLTIPTNRSSLSHLASFAWSSSGTSLNLNDAAIKFRSILSRARNPFGPDYPVTSPSVQVTASRWATVVATASAPGALQRSVGFHYISRCASFIKTHLLDRRGCYYVRSPVTHRLS